MKDRDNTHEDAISGGADTLGPADSDSIQRVDDADTREALDSETAALLGSSLRPVAPPAVIRAALLEAVAREPQAGQSVGAADSDDRDDRDDRDTDSDAGGTSGAAAGRGAGSADSADSSIVPLDAHRRRRSTWRAGLMRAAAAVVLLGVGIGVGRWSARVAVDEAMDSMAESMAPTQHYAHLNQAQDVQRVTDTMPDGHVATLTWSQDMSMTALTLPAAMKDSAGDRSLQVWLKEGERTTSLGVYDPRDGTGFSFLDIMPRPGQQIVITMEPAGGSPQPTTPPLVTLRERGDPAGTATGSPPPEPSSTPAGDSA